MFDIGLELMQIKTMLFVGAFVFLFGIPLPFDDDDDDDDDSGYEY